MNTCFTTGCTSLKIIIFVPATDLVSGVLLAIGPNPNPNLQLFGDN